jgi:predicted transcriptional regulator
MPYKYLKILKYIKKHPNCSTCEIEQNYKKQTNTDIFISNLVEENYCQGIETKTMDRPYDYVNLVLTIKGYDALSWKNTIPIIKEIFNLIKYLKS